MAKDDLRPLRLTVSERRVLDALFHNGSVTQGELVDAFELTQQSISRIIGSLVERRLIEPSGKISGTKGYRAGAFRLAGTFAHSIGVSITAGTVFLVMIDFAGQVIARRKKHPRSMTVASVAEWIEATVAEVRNAAQASGVFSGIGISVAGSFIDERTFNTPSYLEDWAGIDVQATLSEHLGCTVLAENDGNAAALAEGVLGVGKEARSFAYLYLSAGVGGGLILDGQLWRGRFGNAGEFAGGLPPDIYPFPNLELLRVLVARDGHSFDTVDELVSNYDPSWPAIDAWIARVQDSISIIASNATAILDLDAIVFGGLTPPDLARRLAAKVQLYDQRRRSVPRPMAKLVPSELPSDAAAIGAAMLPLFSKFFSIDTAGRISSPQPHSQAAEKSRTNRRQRHAKSEEPASGLTE